MLFRMAAMLAAVGFTLPILAVGAELTASDQAFLKICDQLDAEMKSLSEQAMKIKDKSLI